MSSRMNTNPKRLFLFHGPGCRDGNTTAAIVWNSQLSKVKEYLKQYGGMYSSEKRDPNEPSPHTPEMALKIVKEWKLDDIPPHVFVFIYPNTMLPDDLVKGFEVFFGDLDLGAKCLTHLMSLADTISGIDHHPTSFDTLKTLGFKDEDFDDEEGAKVITRGRTANQKSTFVLRLDTRLSVSAASLTWNYFGYGPIPPFVTMIQIDDTWQWDQKVPIDGKERSIDVKAYMEGLYINDGMRNFESICQHIKEPHIDEYVAIGKVLLKHKDALVDSIAKKANLGYMTGKLPGKDGKAGDEKTMNYTVLYISSIVYASEVADRMRTMFVPDYAKKGIEIDFTVVWNYKPDENGKDSIYTVSLRCPRSTLDLGIIARNLKSAITGGGHAGASGATFPGKLHITDIISKTPFAKPL
jgi:hypothetical protein